MRSGVPHSFKPRDELRYGTVKSLHVCCQVFKTIFKFYIKPLAQEQDNLLILLKNYPFFLE